MASCAIELVTAPVEIYWSPLGTGFPDIDDAPISPWTLLGTLGSRRYSDEGVSIAWDIETEDFVSLGDIDPECVFLTGRNLTVSVQLVDMKLAQLRAGLNFNPVVAAGGVPPRSTLDMTVGPTLTAVALLVRGTAKSPEFEGGNLQFEFANVIEVGSKEVTFTKGEPAMVALEFRVLAGTKRILAQSAA